jgi:lysine N6-hydroxylase
MTAPHEHPPEQSHEQSHERPLDLVGVGLGPFNLAVAALADPLPDLRAAFFDQRDRFAWHPGLLLDGTTLQVPFLADLVTLADPTNRWSFLNYLAEHDRLFPFYFAERFHIPRREYDAYCRWVAESLPDCRFGSRVEAVAWCADASDPRGGHFAVTVVDARGEHLVRARDVVLGLGTEPQLPAPLADLGGDGVVSSGAYLSRRDALLRAEHVTVVGSGQSGAEVVLDLLRADGVAKGPAVTWVTRTPAFAPMEYSKLGLEHFTPDYTRYFSGLPEATRRRLVPDQWQLYKAASADTLAEVFDALYDRSLFGGSERADLLPGTELVGARRVHPGRIEIAIRHGETGASGSIRTDAVVAATGYRPVAPTVLDPMATLVDWNGSDGSYRLDENCRVALAPSVGGSLYVLNAALHEHGVGTPDLGLGAHRAARIVNDVVSRNGLGKVPYRLPERTAFTTFGFDDGAQLGLGGAA